MVPPNSVLSRAILLGSVLFIGCATPYIRGQSALSDGRYGEAAAHFQDVLAHDPDRLDALVGLGISRYKAGRLDEAVDDLSRALVGQPDSKTARLYLALGFLRRGDDRLAEAALVRLRELEPHPRLAAQIDRALRLIQQQRPLTEELRDFIAASLEDEADWVRELREGRIARAGAFVGSPGNFWGVEPFVGHRTR